MVEAAFSGLGILLTWPVMVAMLIGIAIGTIVAVAPQGLGTPLVYSLLIPIIINFEPAVAVSLLLGIGQVTNTGNTFLPVLFSIPGGAGAQAIILDGYPMGRRGEAKRALGAGFTASIIGGLFGTLILALSIPIARPLVLAMGSPELLMLCIWGISMVAVLAGPQPIKGFIAAAFGLLLVTVGVDRSTAIPRYMLGQLYLMDGIPITIIALGTFAIPAALDLMVRKSGVEDQPVPLGSGLFEGIKDVFREWWLVLRCSALGVWIGFIPGLGSQVADWMAYAHAAQTCKGAAQTFGKGDVRGVISCDSTNSSREGGALIPTLAFGVPGSFTLALFMMALITMGITPGPKMLVDHLDLIWVMIWVLTFSAIIGGFICLGLIGPLAKLATVRYSVLVPLILMMCFVGSLAATRDVMDMILLVIFGAIGFLMRRYGYPRPPLLLAVVLGSLMEKYLFISMRAYDFGWLTHPGVLIILALLIISLVFALRSRQPQKSTAEVRS